MWGRLGSLSRGLLLGASLEEFLKSHIVLSRLGQQGWGVLLGKQAQLGHSTISKSHEWVCSLRTKQKREGQGVKAKASLIQSLILFWDFRTQMGFDFISI